MRDFHAETKKWQAIERNVENTENNLYFLSVLAEREEKMEQT